MTIIARIPVVIWKGEIGTPVDNKYIDQNSIYHNTDRQCASNKLIHNPKGYPYSVLYHMKAMSDVVLSNSLWYILNRTYTMISC